MSSVSYSYLSIVHSHLQVKNQFNSKVRLIDASPSLRQSLITRFYRGQRVTSNRHVSCKGL